jgi:hypothetical protein
MIIIFDSREKAGIWDFSKYDCCEGQAMDTLGEGDYTLFGYENLIAIERKRTVAEISQNLGKYYDRFKREFERLQKYKYKYCICEFTLEQLLEYPKNSTLPAWKIKTIKMNGKFMLKRINELEAEYKIEFIFCRDKIEAEEKAMELFQQAIKDVIN